MDVTNPGLVNVADQVVGNPSTAVQSLAIPEDSNPLPAEVDTLPPHRPRRARAPAPARADR